nr:retrovirus-related Pol polyprotein from transposon TNT 1-94 [Tanacetum cinerariifolium]
MIGLPKLKYVKDQLCSSCELSKAKRSSFKSKVVPSSKGMLNLLHMDLCRPMRVASINGKKYILKKENTYRMMNLPILYVRRHKMLLSLPYTTLLATDPEMCMYVLTVSTAELKNIKEAMADCTWIEAMQEELHQFDRLQVWELLDKPFGKMVIRLKWLWKNKKDEDQTVIRNKAQLVANGTQDFSNLSDGRENGISKWSTKGGGQSIGTPMATKPKLDADSSGNHLQNFDYCSKLVGVGLMPKQKAVAA